MSEGEQLMKTQTSFKKWITHSSTRNDIFEGASTSILIGSVVGLLYFPFFNMALLIASFISFTMFSTIYFLDAIFASFQRKEIAEHTHFPYTEPPTSIN